MYIKVQFLLTFYIDMIIDHKYVSLKLWFSLNPPKLIPTNINETTVISSFCAYQSAYILSFLQFIINNLDSYIEVLQLHVLSKDL